MKKVTWIMIFCLVISCLTGCNTKEKALIEELTQIANWPFINLTFSGKLVFENSKDSSSHKEKERIISYKVIAELDIENQRTHFVVEAMDSIEVKPLYLEGYVVEDRLILDKAYYTKTYPYHRYEKITESYIGRSIPDELKGYIDLFYQGNNVGSKALELLNKEKVELPLTRNGDQYSMLLDEESFSKGSVSLLKACLNHIGELYDLVEQPFGEDMDPVERAEVRNILVKTVDEKFKDGQLYEMYYYFLKGAIYGSKCDIKMEFDNDIAQFWAKGKLAYMTSDNVSFDFNLSLAKGEKQDVVTPKDLKQLSSAEENYYEQTFYKTFQISDDIDSYGAVIDKNGKKYFPVDVLDCYIKEEENAYYLMSGSFDSYMHLRNGISSKKLKNEINDIMIPTIKCNPIKEGYEYYLSKQELETLGFEIVKENEQSFIVYYRIPVAYFDEQTYDKLYQEYSEHIGEWYQ